MDNLTGSTIKGYELRERIGAGGFGAVYRAYQEIVDREVAIKVILPEHANQPEFIRNFESEAQTVARLEHPYIIPLFDFWRDPDGAFLVMRWLRGGNLTQLLKQGPLPLDRVITIIEQIASGLHVAHRAGVVHRDLKPDNILLDEEGNAYLSDFGIAKAAGHNATDENVSGSLRYIAPEQLQALPPEPQADLYSLGVMLFEMLAGKHPFSGYTPSELITAHIQKDLPSLFDFGIDVPDEVDDIIQKATAKEPGDRYASVKQIALDLKQAHAPDIVQFDYIDEIDPSDIVNPYKGLRAFQEADAADFFGRQLLVEQLLGRLTDDDPYQRFLAVVGPSGSGKSSAVRAGLIPTLKQGGLEGSQNWFFVDMVPGSEPIRQLESALLSVAQAPPSRLYEMLKADEGGLLWATDRVLAGVEGDLVLLIDQFEEVFTMVESEDERIHFLRLLRIASSAHDSRLRVIVTLRADFTDRPLEYVEFGELMRRRTEFVLPLSADEIQQAITGPAYRVGLIVDPNLVARIVNDVSEEPGALPLLQYSLTEVFERRDGRHLTLAAYQDSGGVLGALARRAEEVYVTLSQNEQQATRQLMLRMVTLGEGTEDTRRRANRSELVEVIRDTALLQSILDEFGKFRLLTFDVDSGTREPMIEVAHEALIREWGRLREWLDTSRADVRLQRVLASEAREWEKADHDTSFLLSGARLTQYEEWADSTDLAMTDEELNYLSASIEDRKRRDIAEQQRRSREEETAKRAEQFAQRAAQLRRAAIALGVVIVIAIVATIMLVSQVRSTQSEVAAGQIEIAAGQTEIAAGQIEIAAVEPILQAANTEISDAETQVAGVEPTVLAAEEQIAAAEAQIAVVQPTLDAGNTQVAQANDQIQVAEAQALDAANQVSTADAQIEDARFQATVAAEQVATANAQVDAIVPTIDAANAQVVVAGTQVADAQGQATAAAEQVISAETQVANAEAQVAGVEPTLAAAETRIAGVEPTLAAADSQIESANTQVAGAQGQATVAAVQVATADAQVADAQVQAALAAEQISTANAQVSVAQVEATRAAEQVIFAETQVAGVGPTLDAAETRVAGVNPTLEVAEAQINQAATQVSQAQVQATQAAAEVQAAQQQAIIAGEQVALAETQIAGVNPTLNAANAQIDLAATQVVDAQIQATFAAQEVATAQVAAVVAGEQVAIAETQIAGVEPTLARAETQIAGVEPTLAQAQTQIAGVEPTLTAVQIEISDQRAISDALRLVRSAQQLLDTGNPDLAIALILEAYKLNPTLGETQRILNEAAPLTTRLSFTEVDGGLLSSDSRFIALNSGANVEIWDPATRRRLQVLVGNSRVTDLVFSPDSQRMIFGTQQGTLFWYDAGTGELLKEIRAHSGAINDLAYHPLENKAITGGADQTSALWNLDSGQLIYRLEEGHLSAVQRVAFNSNGSEAYSWDFDGANPHIGIYRLGIPPFLNIIPEYNGIAFAGNLAGNLGWTGGDGTGFIRIYDADTSVEQRFFQRGNFNEDYIDKIVFSNDGTFLMAHVESRLYATADRFVITNRHIGLWDVRTGAEILRLQVPQEDPNTWDVYSLDISSDGELGLVGTQIGRVYAAVLYDLTTGEELRRLAGHQSPITHVEFSEDRQYALTISQDENVRIWDIGVRDSGLLTRLRFREDSVDDFALSADGEILYLAHNNQALAQWNVNTGEKVPVTSFFTGVQQLVAFSPTTPHAVVLSADGFVLWDIEDRVFVRRLDMIDIAGLQTVEFSEDGKWLFVGTSRSLTAWDMETFQQVYQSTGNTSAIAISHNNEFVAVSNGSSVKVLDIITNQVIREFSGYEGDVLDIDFSPNNDQILVALSEPDNAVILYSLQSDVRIFTLIGHSSSVNVVAYSNDGQQAMSGADDGDLILWDLPTGQGVRTYEGHKGPIQQIVFSPNGFMVMSRSTLMEEGVIGWEYKTVADTVNWIYANRYVQVISCQQRQQYSVQPLCDENGVIPTPMPTPTPQATATSTPTSTPRPTLTPSSTPYPQGIVTTTGGSKANLRTGAGAGFSLVGQVDNGVRVDIVEERLDIGWIKIRTADGMEGWTLRDVVSYTGR